MRVTWLPLCVALLTMPVAWSDVVVDAPGVGVAVDTDGDGVANDAQQRPALAGDQMKMEPMRVSEIIGANVENTAGESLGAIEDIVLDPKQGKVRYAAVSMGGFLGLGEKLFAVPWSAMQCKTEDGEHVIVLDVDKERMANAQGFDADRWPNMADEAWQVENDRYYGPRDHAADHSTVVPQR